MPSSSERRKNFSHLMTTEEEWEVKKNGGILSVLSIVFMLVSFFLVHYETVDLYPSKMNADLLKGYATKVEYTVRYQTLIVAWLLANVLITIYGRITTWAVNPLDERTEPSVQMIKNILTNSLESIVISVFSQLILVSFAEPITVLKYIPLINIVQLIGRLAFIAGYPMKRSFGMMCTLVPNIIMNIYNVYKLAEFVLA